MLSQSGLVNVSDGQPLEFQLLRGKERGISQCRVVNVGVVRARRQRKPAVIIFVRVESKDACGMACQLVCVSCHILYASRLCLFCPPSLGDCLSPSFCSHQDVPLSKPLCPLPLLTHNPSPLNPSRRAGSPCCVRKLMYRM